MNSFKLDSWISSLGKTHAELLGNDVIQASDLIEVYAGTDYLHSEPEAGVDFSFWAETKILEAIIFTLIKITPSEVVFEDSLPSPYDRLIDKEKVRNYFGSPMESRGPMRLPSPLGQIGGWDQFDLGHRGHPNVYVMFKYTVEFDVKGMSFGLIDRGHDKY